MIEEMISQLDLDTLFEAFKVTAEFEIPTREHFMEYIKLWASAKQPLYEKMGRVLRIEEEYEIPPSADGIYSEIKALARKYPAYAAQLLSFSPEEWAENRVDLRNERDFRLFYKNLFKEGAKPSKIMSKMMNDAQFDIDLSVVLQNRTEAGFACLSIHPMDYIMMSTNHHGWGSCMHIINGFNKVGGYSLMIDNASTICYSAKKKMYDYETVVGSFKWYNMIAREVFYISDDRFILGHRYGSPSSKLIGMWIDIAKKVVGCQVGCTENGEVRGAGEHYYDTIAYKRFAPDEKQWTVNMGVKNLYCVVCGSPYTERTSYSGWLCCKKHRKRLA